MSIRTLKWMLLGPVLALLPLGVSFGAEWPAPPPGQPEQMWSRIDYDPNLSDPFFESNEWSYPSHIIKHPDGSFEDTSSDKRPAEEPPHVKHTAKCLSISMGAAHPVEFCEARLLDVNAMDLFIHNSGPGYHDALRVRIRNGMFTCQYWTLYKQYIPGPLIWTTKRQSLTLDKKAYRSGDVIKGKIDFECLDEQFSKHLERDAHPVTINLYGVFKTVVE